MDPAVAQALNRIAEALATIGRPGDPAALGYVSPGGTIPFPAPDARFRPVAYLVSPAMQLDWQTLSTGQDPLVQASWSTTLYDMRPDTINADAKNNPATRVNRTAGTQLFIAISGLQSGGSHLGMEAFVQHAGHPSDARAVAPYTPETNVTAAISNGLDLAILSALPFSGYPMRFWRYDLIFRFRKTRPATLPRISVQGAIY